MEEKIKVTWSFSALEMLAEVHEYMSEKSEQAADDYIDGIFKTTLKLEKKSIQNLVHPAEIKK